MVKVALEPIRDEHLVAAIDEAGGQLVPIDQAQVLVWIGGAADFPQLPDGI